MKKILHIFLVLFAVSEGISQVNLVPNPSFEEFSVCPEQGSIISMALHWSNANEFSPDYFNSCAITTEGYSVPNNFYGFQVAKTGNAHAGIISMTASDLREYIQVELNQSLIQGKTYCISFFVSCSDSSIYCSNDIGMFLSETEIFQNSSFNLNFVPQIQNDPINNPLNDKINWIEVKGEYIAQGGEKHIIIGNFKPNNQTDTTILLNQGWQNYSYHYIDDVSIELCDDLSIYQEKINSIYVYPIPSNKTLNIDSKEIIDEIKIIDMNGLHIETITNTSKNKASINVEHYQKGFYFLHVKTSSSTNVSKIIIN
jgi:hypothetical protein